MVDIAAFTTDLETTEIAHSRHRSACFGAKGLSIPTTFHRRSALRCIQTATAWRLSSPMMSETYLQLAPAIESVNLVFFERIAHHQLEALASSLAGSILLPSPHAMRVGIFFFVHGALASLLGPFGRHCPRNDCKTVTDICGQTYGGCYDGCVLTFDEAFPAPACLSSVSLAEASVAPLTTEAPSLETALSIRASSSSCRPSSICVDYINSCYMRYGGCIDANHCDGSTKSIVVPSCPTVTTAFRRKAVPAVTTPS